MDELLLRVGSWLTECDGVTISGGEPFDQTHALEQLLRGIRNLTPKSILVYSGRRFSSLSTESLLKKGLIDCLISEPFELHTPQTRHLMGSDNQRMNFLTPLGRQVFLPLNRRAEDSDRRLDVMFDKDGVVWLAGIPSRGDMDHLQALLEAQGDQLQTTRSKV